MAANIGPAVAFEQRSNVRRLVCSVLQKQYSVVGEYGRAVGSQHTNRVETIVAGGQRRLRFVLKIQ